MKEYNLKISPARRHFKQRIGQANHLLITTLVGLDGVRSKKFTLSDEFSTSWNPRDVVRSAERSIRFILDSSLGWVVDNLDSYFIEANRKPSIIESDKIRREYDGTGRSVNHRFILFHNEAQKTNKEIDKYAALVALAIQWRNNIVHFGANNELDTKYKSILIENKKFYTENFRHLNVEKMLASFESKDKNPSFKEVTSMINAIHKFVELLDVFLLNSLDVDRFKNDILDMHFSSNKLARGKVKNLSEKRKEIYHKTLFRQYGFEVE